jgi:hypothetical protein
MAVIVHVVLPGVTQEQYDAVRKEVGWLDTPPTGGLAHLTWWDGADCHNVDAWEDEASFGAFGQDRLGPALGKLGIETEVNAEFHPAHEVYTVKAVTITTT